MIALLIIAAAAPVERAVRRGGVRHRRRAARRDRPPRRQAPAAGASGPGRAARSAPAGPLHRHRADRHHRRQPRVSACTASTSSPTGSGNGSVAAPCPPGWSRTDSPASLAVAILTYFHVVIGEMIPKSLALQSAERMALAITPVMLWIQTLLLPFVVTLNGLGNVVLARLGSTGTSTPRTGTTRPEELQLIVEESEEQGALRSESGQVLQELFEFGELTAGEVMVPRVRITGIPVGAGPDRLRADHRAPSAHALSDLRRRSGSHRRHVPHQGSAAAAA